MKRLLIFLALVAGLMLSVAPVAADNTITVLSSQFTCNFGKNMLFQLEAQSSANITKAELVLQFDSSGSNFRGAAKFDAGKKIKATYDWNLSQKYLPPGASGQFWWEIQDEVGNQLQTPPQSFRVDDSARPWQKLSNDKLTLYWYGASASFGQALFDRAFQTMQFLEQDTGVIVDRRVQIFVYPSRKDFFQAAPPGSGEGLLGQTFFDNGVVIVNADPTSASDPKVTTTHEMTHVIIHAKILSALGESSLPTWLDEGLATYYGFYPDPLDPNYAIPFKRAIENDTLLSIRSISGAYPTVGIGIDIAYAEGYSMVDFIYRKYGKAKMAQLLQEIKKGGYYDDILKKVLGVDTDGLEIEWRKDIGAKPRVIPTRSSATATPFPTFSIASDATPVPRAATPVPAPTPRAPSNPISQLCGGAFSLIAVGILGPVLYRRMRRLVR